MSEISYLPSVPLFCINDIPNMNIIVEAITYDTAIAYFTNKADSRIPISKETQLFHYTTNKYLDIDYSCDTIPLSSSDSYRIEIKNKAVFNCRMFANGVAKSLSETCEFPYTTEEFRVYNSTRFTSLIRADIQKDSDQIHVSSLFGMEIGRAVEADGIDEYAYITSIDYTSNTIQISEPAIETASHITIRVC
jgi:hypothetical protein